jgi:plastocyanin
MPEVSRLDRRLRLFLHEIQAQPLPQQLADFKPATVHSGRKVLNVLAGTVGVAIIAATTTVFAIEVNGHKGAGSPAPGNGLSPSPAVCNGSAAVSGLGTVASTDTVSASNELVFSPASLTTHVGAVVEFMNTGTVTHTVTFQDANDGCLSDAALDPGATWEVKFTTAGTYNYACMIHAPNMTGEITVLGS